MPALLYKMTAEALVRELTGSGRVTGSHLVPGLADGSYALLGTCAAGRRWSGPATG